MRCSGPGLWQDLSATRPCCHARRARSCVHHAPPRRHRRPARGPAARRDRAGRGPRLGRVRRGRRRRGLHDRGRRARRRADPDRLRLRDRAGRGALEAVRGPIDTLLVAGGAGARRRRAPELVARVRRLAARARPRHARCAPARSSSPPRACSTAAARRPTGRWCDDLAAPPPGASRRARPDLRPRRNVLHLRGRHRRHGPRARARRGGPRPARRARGRAAGSCVFVRRPGGQAQFSAQLAAQSADRAPLRELQAWIADHLDADLSVPALAGGPRMSQRHFARAFRPRPG